MEALRCQNMNNQTTNIPLPTSSTAASNQFNPNLQKSTVVGIVIAKCSPKSILMKNGTF